MTAHADNVVSLRSHTVDVHPLFADDDLEARRPPLTEPIDTIDVCPRVRTTAAREYRIKAWRLAAELPDEMALLEQFGAGEYMLIGRNQNRSRVLRKAFVKVGDYPPYEGQEAASAAAPAASAPTHDAAPQGAGIQQQLLMMLVQNAQAEAREAREDARAMRSDMAKLVMAFAEKSERSGAEMVKAMSGLFEARLTDQKTIIEALTKKNGGNAPAPDMVEQFEQLVLLSEGMKQLQGTGGEDSLEKLAGAFMEGWAKRGGGDASGGA